MPSIRGTLHGHWELRPPRDPARTDWFWYTVWQAVGEDTHGLPPELKILVDFPEHEEVAEALEVHGLFAGYLSVRLILMPAKPVSSISCRRSADILSSCHFRSWATEAYPNAYSHPRNGLLQGTVSVFGIS